MPDNVTLNTCTCGHSREAHLLADGYTHTHCRSLVQRESGAVRSCPCGAFNAAPNPVRCASCNGLFTSRLHGEGSVIYCRRCLLHRVELVDQITRAVTQATGLVPDTDGDGEMMFLGRPVREVVEDTGVSTYTLESMLSQAINQIPASAQPVAPQEVRELNGIPVVIDPDMPEGTMMVLGDGAVVNVHSVGAAAQPPPNDAGLHIDDLDDVAGAAEVTPEMLERARRIIANPDTRAELERLYRENPQQVAQVLATDEYRRSQEAQRQQQRVEELREAARMAHQGTLGFLQTDVQQVRKWQGRNIAAPSVEKPKPPTDKYTADWFKWYLEETTKCSRRVGKFKSSKSDLLVKLYFTERDSDYFEALISEDGEVSNKKELKVAVSGEFSGSLRHLWQQIADMFTLSVYLEPDLASPSLRFSFLDEARCVLSDISVKQTAGSQSFSVSALCTLPKHTSLVADYGIYELVRKNELAKQPVKTKKRLDLSIPVR